MIYIRLCKIKNKYLFKSDNPEGNHTYAVYYDKKSKKNRAIQLTHVYVRDEKRFEQIKKGNIKLEKFKEFDVPSGVKNRFYDKDINGNNIDLSDKTNVIVSKRKLSDKQANRIIKFAKYREE